MKRKTAQHSFRSFFNSSFIIAAFLIFLTRGPLTQVNPKRFFSHALNCVAGEACDVGRITPGIGEVVRAATGAGVAAAQAVRDIDLLGSPDQCQIMRPVYRPGDLPAPRLP
jgi:hypothetical protein